MNTILILLSVAFVAALAGPTISDNFVAVVEAIEEGRPVDNVRVWEDYSHHRVREDFTRPDTRATVQRFRFYTLKKEYIIEEATKNCTVLPLTQTENVPFGWAANATLDTHPCHAGQNLGKVGKLWYDNRVNNTRSLCASEDGDTPYWVEVKFPDRLERFRFHSFLPGVPPPNVFVLPTYCATLKHF
eukprot:TRINITY_DN599_c0_g2_i3.p1 TRINITY_DN599_c0_g2~~TRINITY_DN599_c0_g2_i3.p1  ORF type:complete len:187 (+),score=38.30 TRINITY_DN599_c0_g2_i3:84-644(+)